MTDLNVKYRFRQKFRQYQPALEALSTPVMIGDANGVVDVPGHAGYIYVRPETGDMPPMEVFNKKVTPAAGEEVFIGYTPQEPNLLQVIDTHTGSSQFYATGGGGRGGTGTVPPHEWTHRFLMPDQLLIQKRAMLPGRLSPSTLTGSRAAVALADDIVWVGGQFRYIEPRTIDLTAHIPATAGHSRYVAISVDATGAIAITDGADIASLTPALSDAPAIPTANVLLGFVRLYAGMLNLQEYFNGNTLYTDFLDVRSMAFRVPGGGSGGGGGNGGGDYYVGKVLYDATLTGNGDFTLTGIPQDYDDLEIILEGYVHGFPSPSNVNLELNGDTVDANYARRILYNFGSTLTGIYQTSRHVGYLSDENDAPLMGLIRIKISSYSNSVRMKTYETYNADPVVGGYGQHIIGTTWGSSAAITHIKLSTVNSPDSFTVATRCRVIAYKVATIGGGTRGSAILSGGTITVTCTNVTANSLIYLTVQTLGTVTVPKALYPSARVPGTSFTITSADATDTSTVAWQVIEP